MLTFPKSPLLLHLSASLGLVQQAMGHHSRAFNLRCIQALMEASETARAGI